MMGRVAATSYVKCITFLHMRHKTVPLLVQGGFVKKK